MSQSEKAIIKPEVAKSYIWLQTADGSIQQIEQEVAIVCPMICRELLRKGKGSSKNNAISLPEQVTPAILSLILDYCRFHQLPGRSNKERKSFNEKFVKIDADLLCELTSAAYSLELGPLCHLCCGALARIMGGKTNEEIREIFHIPDDLTEEEKLEPLKNPTDDPRVRLLNRLNARKRKILKQQQEFKDVKVEEERVDRRKLEDLLKYINGRDEAVPDCVRTAKQGTKNRKENDKSKNSSKSDVDKTHKKEETNFAVVGDEASETLSPNPSRTSEIKSVKDVFADISFEDAYSDDDLDPARKEELDREVEEFARRLNCDWLYLGHEKKPIPNVPNGNHSFW